MKVLVIIVTYNGIRWIKRCLSSVRGYDLFVVDNGSTDGTQEFIQSHCPDVVLKQSEKNLGFGKANNIGLKYAIDHDYDYVYLMNQDAWVMTDTIETLVEVNRKHREYGILSPMQMKADLKHMDSIFGTKVCVWETNSKLIEDCYHHSIEDVYEVPFVMAAHWLISRECLKRVGGFSPTFPHYGEDDNYVDRARFHGFKVGVAPKAKAVHDRGEYSQWSTKKRMYINNYIIPLRKLSDISHSVNPWPVILKNAFAYPLLFKSLRPVGYLLQLLWEYPVLKKNRERSKQQGVFINDY